MLTRKHFWWLPLASAFLLLAGCRAPLAVNRALVPRREAVQIRKFFGVWKLRQRPKGAADSVACVYPLGKRRYVITLGIYKSGVVRAKPELKGEATFIGSLSEVRGRLWMSCRTMDPRLINSASMQRWWARHLPAGQPGNYGSALRKTELEVARAAGMARVFYLVELKTVSRDRLEVYPLLVPATGGHRSTFEVPVKILQSRKNLAAFLDSHTLSHLLPKRPWIFGRLTGSRADVYMPAQ